MSDYQHIQQGLEGLAHGIHPTTGEPLPADSVFNDPAVIRLLFATLQWLQESPARGRKTVADKQEDNIRRQRPRNAGLPWDEDARRYVSEHFQQGDSPAQIAQALERTRSAVVAELRRQELISASEAMKL